MHLPPIRYIDRLTGTEQIEKVYGERALALLYGDSIVSRILGPILLHTLAKTSPLSQLYGWWQRKRWSRRKILPFIEAYDIDTAEIESPVDSFQSFDAFFTRKVRPETRPIAAGEDVAVAPADGRYLCYQQIHSNDDFLIKGQRFDLDKLLADAALARRYEGGSMAIVRLCPTDCHRFYFPCSGTPERVRLIAGWLYSVNPAALRHNLRIFTENKRMVTVIDSDSFGMVTAVEVGATNVGSIRQTYIANQHYNKGKEKGFFSFGGSAIILLFEKERITLDADLVNATDRDIETHCLIGQRIGIATESY